MRVGVIGSGALGLYYGSLLQKGGHDVHFLLRRDYQAITTQGLKVESPNGNFHLTDIKGYRHSCEIGLVDLVLIGLKAYANNHLLELVRPLVGPDTVILTLQNGLGNEDLLATEFNPEQVIGGVAFLCCNRGAPGTVHHLDQGSIRLAEFSARGTKRVEQIGAMFTASGVACEACADLTRIRWEKLVWNIPFNGLCALTGLSTNQLLCCPQTRQLIAEMMQEVINAANRQELTEAVAGEPFIERMLTVTESMGAYRPSMMIDRQKRHPLELEAIYRTPLERAAAVGAPMKQVAMLHALLEVTENH